MTYVGTKIESVCVVICTWNRSSLLRNTLEEMRKLRIPKGLDWTILVVDNNSTDDTASVVADFETLLPVTRILESRQGLSHARNLGLELSVGDLILYTDDDVLVDPGWIAAYVEAAASFPEAPFFGGTQNPWFEEPPPRWIADNLSEFGGPYGIRRYGEDVRPFGPGELPFGANMMVRRKAVGDLRFNPSLGRSGSYMLSGEETDFLGRMREAATEPGVWVGHARVRHFVPKSRTTKSHLLRFYQGLGETAVDTEELPTGRCFRNVPLWMWREYGTVTALGLLHAPFRDRAWVQAFRRRAFLQGFIAACQGRHREQQTGLENTSP